MINSIINKIRNQINKVDASDYNIELDFVKSFNYFNNLNRIYSYYKYYYENRSPQIIRDHRRYITLNKKGFGEDAFHAMWWLLLLKFKPKTMLEIGVYRGQTVSLWSLIMKYINSPCDIHCISPFSSVGDTVSKYDTKIDYYKDTIETFEYWKLTPPTMVRSYSTDDRSVEHIRSKKWDLIYIDGSHDYEIVLADFKICSSQLKKGGILVMDDASLFLEYQPDKGSFAGHPGPSKVAREYGDTNLKFIGAVGHNNIFINRVQKGL